MLSSIPHIDWKRFNVDVLINICSVAVLGFSGLFINLVIAKKYGVESLGVFQQVFSIYVVLSQLAALGIQNSLLKHVAEHYDNPDERGALLASALVLVGVVSAGLSCLVYGLSSHLSGLFDSPRMASGLAYAAIALVFFAVNKLLFSYINGLSWMRTFAAFSSLRYILLVVFLLGMILLHRPGDELPLIFLGSEIVLFIAVAVRLLAMSGVVLHRPTLFWMREHVRFGIKSIASGIFLEINTRTDILVLGLFFSDFVVGVYSFVANIIEGLNYIPYMIRRNLDPYITRMYLGGHLDELRAAIKRIRTVSFMLALLIAVLAIAAYPLLISIFSFDAAFGEGWGVLCVLIAGFVVMGTFIPLSGCLIQSGYPGYHSILIGCYAGSNLALNFLVVPAFSMYGAAAATVMASVLYVLMLIYMFKRMTKVSLV